MPPKMHKLTLDLTGHTYGQLLVVAYAGRRNKHTYWRCKCLACGSVGDYNANSLRRGHSTRCRGCRACGHKRDRPGYHAWKRITTTGKVCTRWLSFERFIADMGKPPEGKPFLMRIDPTKAYKPGNCRWAGSVKSRFLTHNGRTMSMSDWARELGLSRQGLHFRLQRMPVHQALTKPVRKRS